MRVTVRVFAMQREVLGWKQRPLDLPDDATVSGAWEALVAAYPDLAPAGGSIRFARNGTYVDRGEPLANGDELALIPPVAGGGPRPHDASEPFRRIEIHEEPFADALLAELRHQVATPAVGAVVTFLGQTRETPGTPAPGETPHPRTGERSVEGLTYETFVSMAVEVLGTIADEIEERFGVRRMAILHRTGEVPLGAASVLIVAAAEHRGAAFDACRYAIEELKARAPIWKQERYRDGSVWIGMPARHGPAGGHGDEEGR